MHSLFNSVCAAGMGQMHKRGPDWRAAECKSNHTTTISLLRPQHNLNRWSLISLLHRLHLILCHAAHVCGVAQVEREIEGKEWTTRMVTELAKTLMDLKDTLYGTQNKAAEIEIGSALHKHVVSSVQNAEVRREGLLLKVSRMRSARCMIFLIISAFAPLFEAYDCRQVLEGGSDSARVDRMKMAEALELCLKSVADRRSEMMMDDVGHGDIEAWISESFCGTVV